MAQVPSNTICLINFEKGIYDITGDSTVRNISASMSTDQCKFGTHSAYFSNANSSYLDITLPSEAKSLSFWFYCTSNNTSDYYPTLFSSLSGGNAGGTYVHVDDGGYGTHPVYRSNSSSSNNNNGRTGSTVITRNKWHHFAYSVSGSSHYYFLDGVLQATVTQASPNTLNEIFIGGLRKGSSMASGCYFTGYIDEILISTDILYTSNFTVPTEAYSVDSEVDPPFEINVTTNYGTYSGRIGNLTDGNTSTYWWSNSSQSVGKYIQFSFSRPVTFNGLTAQTLNNTGDRICSGTVLQISTDGSTWTTVGQFSGGATYTFSDLNQKNVVAVRLYVQTASSNWLCINEITLDYIEETSNFYLKIDGAWTQVQAVYKKVSGSWVEQSDVSGLFDTNAKYKKMN